MTNKELEKELLRRLYNEGWSHIARDGDSNSVFAYNYEPAKDIMSRIWKSWNDEKLCLDFLIKCTGIDFENIQWEDEEPLAIKKYLGIVDWTKVPVDTKVLVRDENDEKWERAYFRRYNKEDFRPFEAFAHGSTAWSLRGYTLKYKQCKLWVEEEEQE